MDQTSQRAIVAAVQLARNLGLGCKDEPECLRDGANLLLHLRPAPVVARIATTTALVRQPPQLWLQRDVDMAAFLAAQGCPAVPSSTEIPPGPHLHDGFAISFWQYVDHDRNYVATASETAARLRELHQVLRGYPGPLDRLNPFYELPGWLDRAQQLGALAADDIAMLRGAYAEIAAKIGQCPWPDQPLHGDAHRKNLLKTARGLLWTDFEDCCRGPVLWDMACYVRAAAEGRATAMDIPGFASHEGDLEPFLEARDLQGAIWLPILATRFADRRPLAAEWLTAARSRYGHRL